MWFIYSHLATRSEGVSWLKFWANINRLLTATRAVASSSPTSIPNEIEYPVDIHTRHLLDVFCLPTGYPLEPFEVTKFDFYEPFGTSVCALILCRLTNKSILGDVESLWVNKAFTKEVFMPRFFFLFVTFFRSIVSSAHHPAPAVAFEQPISSERSSIHVRRIFMFNNNNKNPRTRYEDVMILQQQRVLFTLGASACALSIISWQRFVLGWASSFNKGLNITRNDGKTRTKKVPVEHVIKLADLKLRRRTSL